MKATVERTPGSRVVLDIEVPPEEMAPEITQAFRRVAQQVRIPGFRPGKAPAPLVERAVGRPRILQEALNPLVSRAYREAVDQQGLSPVDQPEIEVKEFEDGQPLHFVATVAVKPEVRLGDYASVRVEPRPDPVGDEDVQKALEELRAARATWVPVEEPAADGHLVILRTTGQVADGPRIDQRRVEGVLGEGHLRPEVEAAVRGLVPGSGRDLELRFPEDDPTPTLRGKTAQVHVELLECKRKELPPLDDGLAAEVSEAQSLEELRAELGNRLRQAAEARSEQAALDDAVRQVVDAAEVELPEVMVARAVDNLLADLQRQLAASGTTLAAYLAAQGRTEEQMRAELRPGAERSVKTGLVLEALARDAHLTPTDADVDAEIGRQAASQQSLDPAHYRRLAVRPETREAIAADLARRSAVRWLHDHALAAHGHSGAAAAEAPEARGGSGPAAGPAKGEDA